MATSREIIFDTIQHCQTEEVPYTLDFEGAEDMHLSAGSNVEARLDAYYGGPHWRDRLKRYITRVNTVDIDKTYPISEERVMDAYGGIRRTNLLPWHLETPPLKSPSFEGYNFPSPEIFFRPDWKEDARNAIAENKDTFIVGVLGNGLFDRSITLRGFENILMDAIDHPYFFEEALDKLMNLMLKFVDYTCDLPIDGILFGDDWGDQRGVIIGPKRWRQFIKPRWAQVYAHVHQHGKIVLHHSCGSVASILPDIIEIGVDVLESVQPEAAGMIPYELKKKYGDKITFWGGLGSQSIIPFGTPAALRAEIHRLRKEMSRGGGYILAPAKPLRSETPTENAVAIVEAFSEQGASG
jgi:uroporphyrinogen decarboxylase